MSMSAEDLRTLIEATVRAVIAAQPQVAASSPAANGGGVNPNPRRLLDPKGVSRVDTFQGKESQ